MDGKELDEMNGWRWLTPSQLFPTFQSSPIKHQTRFAPSFILTQHVQCCLLQLLLWPAQEMFSSGCSFCPYSCLKAMGWKPLAKFDSGDNGSFCSWCVQNRTVSGKLLSKHSSSTTTATAPTPPPHSNYQCDGLLAGLFVWLLCATTCLPANDTEYSNFNLFGLFGHSRSLCWQANTKKMVQCKMMVIETSE